MINESSISKVVIAFTGPLPNETHLAGVMVGYQADPTVLIQMGDGKQANWSAHLCREASPAEAEGYWRDRALAAEAIIKGRLL